MQKQDLNEANKTDLKTIEGISDTLAGRIVKFRDDYGPFYDLKDLNSIRGIGEEKIKKIGEKFDINQEDEDPKPGLPLPFRKIVPCSIDCTSSTEFPSLCSNNDLFIIHVNTDGLQKKLKKLQDLLQKTQRKPDVICVSEIGAFNCLVDNLIEGYVFKCKKSITQKGGVGIFYSTQTFQHNSCEILYEISEKSLFEILCVKITKSHDNTAVIIGAGYRHPSKKLNFFENILSKINSEPTEEQKIKMFYSELKEIARNQNLQEYLSEFYFLGDVNIDLLERSALLTQYCETIIDLGWEELITRPTRIHRRFGLIDRKSLIDHIYTKNTCRSQSGVVETNEISDHFPIYC